MTTQTTISPSASKPLAPAEERRLVARLTTVGVAGNVALALFKLVAGVVGHSTALLADAVHSLSDVFATAIAAVGVRIAQRTADSGHPFGHERFECLASLVLAVVLAATGLGIGVSSIQSLVSGAYLAAEAPGVIALVAAGVSIAVKEGMFWYTRHGALVLNSSAFLADAWHHRSDALSSIGALVGVGLSMAGVPAGEPLASVVICGIVLKVAYDVGKDAVDNMMDAPCAPELESTIKNCIEQVEGVTRIDALRTRRFGSKVYVEAEIAVCGSQSLEAAHAIAERAHDLVESRFPEVKHIMIHENPA